MKGIIRTVLSVVFIGLVVCSWTVWSQQPAGTPGATAVPAARLEPSKTEGDGQIIAALRNQLQNQAARLDQLERQENMTARTVSAAGQSVGLIVGEYVWTDPSGRRALRYAGVDSSGQYMRDQSGNELIGFDGDGPFVVGGFQATGFLVDANRVLTSGFILAPWATDPLLDESENPQIIPNMRSLEIYFPGVKEALTLKIDRGAETGDAVLCNVQGGAGTVKGLRISTANHATIGEPIVVLGYPGGVDLLLSRVPTDVRREIFKFGTPSPSEIARQLADRGYIQPIAMQSRIISQADGRVFFETAGAAGGTGAPVINSAGLAVAMSQGNHTSFPSFNLASTLAPLAVWAKAR